MDQQTLPGTEQHEIQKYMPLLKWAGGKRWLSPSIAPAINAYLEKTDGHYIEPFVGGGAVAFYMARTKTVLTDVCVPLIDTYTAVRDDPYQLSVTLREFERIYVGEDGYYALRDRHLLDDPTSRAARMIYLNKRGFNGMYRENAKGQNNVPYGKQDRALPDFEAITEAAAALHGSELACMDFEGPISTAKQGDLIFADPPYDETFSNYAAGGFDRADQIRLAQALHKASQSGAVVITTNADTELIRSLYGAWCWTLQTAERRNVNSDGGGRGPVPCLLMATDEQFVRNGG